MALTIKLAKRAQILVAASVAVGAGFAADVAIAQDPQRGVPVAERPRPDYDAVGIRAGSFLFLPELSISETYNDNIFARQANTDHDLITKVLPKVSLESDWNNHALNLTAGADIGRNLRSSKEKYEDYNFAADGRVDIRRDTSVSASVNYEQLHEDRGSPDDVGGITPTEYTKLSSDVGFRNKWNRVALEVGLGTEMYDYDDVARTGGITNNDDRDRDHYTLSTRLGYEIVPEYEGFVKASYNTIDYDAGTDDNGLNRDSDGYEVAVGTRLDLSGVLSGDVFAGYRSQDYDDAALETISGPVVGASLTWNVTALTTIKGSVSRTILETTQAGSSGFFNTRVGASVDHELRRNLLVGADVAGTNQKYRGNGRDDNQYDLGAYAKYLLNRHLYVSAEYDFLRKNSNAAGSSYSQNIFMVKLTTQY